MKRISLEVGSNTLWLFSDMYYNPDADVSNGEINDYIEHQNSDRAYPIDAIRNLREKFMDEAGVELDLILYEGIKSPHSSGRLSNLSAADIALRAHSIAREDATFMLAMNGGISHELPFQLNHHEDLALDELQRAGIVGKNKVTVTNPQLFEYIRKNFKDLELIASCFQVLDVENPDGYKEMFDKYEYVVPINQHGSANFLKQFNGSVEQAMVFLDHRCACANLHECYEHAVIYDSLISRDEFSTEKAVIDEKNFKIPVGSYQEKYPSALEINSCVGGELYKREEDLIDILEVGVPHFKIPRDIPVKPEVIDTLINAINYVNKHQAIYFD